MIKEKLKISIVVVNWNGKKWLDKCIRSLLTQDYKNFEILLIDNNSEDGSADYAKLKYPRVKIFVKENSGYGSACNFGAEKAKGKFLMFFNEDMYVDRSYLKIFIDFYNKLNDKEKLGTIGCRVDNYDKTRYYPFDHFGYKIDFLSFPTVNTNPDKVFHNSGCPLFISRDLFLKVKGFCPNIFIYSEDIDLCWRLNLFGYKHYFINETSLYHIGGGVMGQFSPKKLSNYIIGEINTLLNNYSITTLFIVLPIYLLYYTILFVYYSFTLNLRYAHTIISTFVEIFMHKLDKILKFRKFVQSNRIISETKILSWISFIPSRLVNYCYSFLRSNYAGST